MSTASYFNKCFYLIYNFFMCLAIIKIEKLWVKEAPTDLRSY